jgi:hypothetical protein
MKKGREGGCCTAGNDGLSGGDGDKGREAGACLV